MHDLEISWPGGASRFSPDDSPVSVGRAPEADVVLSEPSVSRHHIDFVWNGTAWAARDHSTHGSFDPIGVRLADEWTVGTDTTIRVGGAGGVELVIELLTTGAGSDNRPPVAAEPPSPAAEPPPNNNGTAAADVDQWAPPSAPDGSLSPQAETPPMPAPGPEPAAPAADIPPVSSADVPPLPPTDSPPLPWADAEPAPSPAEATPLWEPPQEAAAGADPADGPDPWVSPVPSAAPTPGADPWDNPAPAPAASSAPPAAPAAAPPVPPTPEGDPWASPATPAAAASPALSAPPMPPPGSPGPGVGDPWAPPDEAAPSHPARPPVPPTPEGGGFDPNAYAPPDTPSPYADLPAPPPSSAPVQADAWSTPSTPTPGVGDLAAATAIGGDTISLSIDDDDYTFLPGTEITIGRDPNSLVRLGERHTLVSRNHLRIIHHSGAWWIEDQSSKGTFIDGKRITKPYRAEGAFIMSLGDDDAGTTVRVVAPGEHVRPKQGRLLWLALTMVAVVVLGIAGVLAVSALRDDEGGETAASLLAAKQATVMLITEEGTLGSGFFVTENLIVTNQHVAAAAPELHVAVSRTADEPAQIEYRATPLALHPYLDIAVLKVTSDMDGNPVEGTEGITGIPIGNSGELTLGDDVYSTGFPATLSLITSDDMGELQLPPVSTTRGEAASFSIWPGCSNPNQADFIPVGSPATVTCAPDGDVDRAIVITTFSSGQGASGSPVLRGGEVVAVVFSGPLDEANAGRNIASSAFSDWLAQLIAQEGG